MEGKTTSVYYKDLTQEEKDFVDIAVRKGLLENRQAFINDPRYKGINPEDIWYLKLDHILNWKHEDNFIFTRCECGSLEFDCIKDTMASDGLSRDCLYRCKKCGKTHQEYN